jgi:hypothetical protein
MKKHASQIKNDSRILQLATGNQFHVAIFPRCFASPQTNPHLHKDFIDVTKLWIESTVRGHNAARATLCRGIVFTGPKVSGGSVCAVRAAGEVEAWRKKWQRLRIVQARWEQMRSLSGDQRHSQTITPTASLWTKFVTECEQTRQEYKSRAHLKEDHPFLGVRICVGGQEVERSRGAIQANSTKIGSDRVVQKLQCVH